MKLGVTTNYTWQGPPITEIARTIEALGFESMWMGEHPIISRIIPAISFGVGALPSWGAEAYADLKPVDPLELLAEYEDAGVGRILVGLNDLEDDSASGALEEAAKGLGLA